MRCNRPECSLGLRVNFGWILPPLGGIGGRESQVSGQENGFYSIWPENKQMFDWKKFRQNVMEALNEIMGAGFFTTEYELQARGDKVEFWSPKMEMGMLASMQEAIVRQRELITKEVDPQQVELLNQQLERLRLEYLGMQRVGELLQIYDRVVWISPPGLGLESEEARINYFVKKGEKVVNYSWVATPNLEGLRDFMRWLGQDLNDDMGVAVGSFLLSPFEVKVGLEKMAGMVRDLNQLSNYQVPGWGVDLYGLMEFVQSFRQSLEENEKQDWIVSLQERGLWFDLKEELEKQVVSFYMGFYGQGKKPTHDMEVAFLQYLLERLIKPWLRVWVRVRYGANEDGFDFMWDQMMYRSSGCGSGLGGGVVIAGHPIGGTGYLWWGLGSVMGQLFSPPGCKSCKARKKKKEEKEEEEKRPKVS